MDSAGGAAPSNGAPSTEVKLYDDDVDDDDNDVDGGNGGGQCKQGSPSHRAPSTDVEES